MPVWAEPPQPACRAAFLPHSHWWPGQRVHMDTAPSLQAKGMSAPRDEVVTQGSYL